MHKKDITTSGKNIDETRKVLIMLHGRGATAGDILSIADHLDVKDFALVAPQATNNTWYPYSFLSPPAENEPWLSSALALLKEIVADIKTKGLSNSSIYFLGFSQGACLTLEFVARNAARYGGVVAFTGGLIGDKLYPGYYQGDFEGTPVFMGTSDPDPHVPVDRVNASAAVFENMHARVLKKIIKHMGHTVNQDEINDVNHFIFRNQEATR